MTTDEVTNSQNLDELNVNVEKIEALSQRLVAALAKRRETDPRIQAPGQELYVKAAGAAMAEMMTNPARILEHQVTFWGKTLQHFVDAQAALASGAFEAPEDTGPNDPRFRNAVWQTHPYFNYVKQQYLLNSEMVTSAVDKLEGLEGRDRQRVSFFSKQIVDLFAPTNFLGTNPEALEKAVETNGQSLIDGLENLVRDIETSDGELQVTLADKDAFRVGENLATTEGTVVFRNRMFELIQYAPKTEKVHKTPLIIFPPWINKFYIMDLKKKNSLINWIVEQGYTLFVVSWKNPDESYANVGLDTYIEEGYLAAIDQVKALTGEKQINAVGYCIAGTTLSLTLSYLAKKGDKSIKSATFFTMLSDFSEQGEFTPFLAEDFIDGIEAEVSERGILESFIMARTFSFLRANDLVYGPAIRSYMMGEAPPAFDLLYWNGDATNLPGRMSVEYLRGLCQDNCFAKDGFEVLGEKLHISDVKVPFCAVACETDHISAWKDSYRGIAKMGSKDRTFILSESGHIAGIINPPSKRKYGHYMNPDLSEDAEQWRDAADFHEGSWWPNWGKWLAGKSGKRILARQPADQGLGAAPGSYVLARKSSTKSAA